MPAAVDPGPEPSTSRPRPYSNPVMSGVRGQSASFRESGRSRSTAGGGVESLLSRAWRGRLRRARRHPHHRCRRASVVCTHLRPRSRQAADALLHAAHLRSACRLPDRRRGTSTCACTTRTGTARSIRRAARDTTWCSCRAFSRTSTACGSCPTFFAGAAPPWSRAGASARRSPNSPLGSSTSSAPVASTACGTWSRTICAAADLSSRSTDRRSTASRPYTIDHGLLAKNGINPLLHLMESSRGCSFKCRFCVIPGRGRRPCALRPRDRGGRYRQRDRLEPALQLSTLVSDDQLPRQQFLRRPHPHARGRPSCWDRIPRCAAGAPS